MLAFALILTASMVASTVVMCRGTPASSFGLRYEPVIVSGEYWRLCASPLVHDDPFHLMLNVVLIWIIAPPAEHAAEWAVFLNAAFVLTSGAIFLSLAFGRLVRVVRPASLLSHPCGFSALLVGLLTDAALRAEAGKMWGGIPITSTPFAFLILTQMLLRNKSLLHHIFGVVMGAVIWIGAFDWLTPWWILCAIVWILAASAFSLRRVFPSWMAWLRYDALPPAEGASSGAYVVEALLPPIPPPV